MRNGTVSMPTLALFGAVAVVPGRPLYTQTSNPDSLAIYSLVLAENRLSGRTSSNQRLVIKRQLTDPALQFDYPPGRARPAYMDPRQRLSYANSETIEAFLRVGSSSVLPDDVSRLPATTVVDHDERTERQWFADWRHFTDRFGAGARLIELSPIAFNAQRTEALLYVSEMCGPLCGKSHFVLVKRTGRRWFIEHVDQFGES